MTRPLLLLDVDGVLNVFGATGEEDAQYREDEVERHTVIIDPDVALGPFVNPAAVGVPFGIVLVKEHRSWLSELAEHFDLAWATTWEHEANRLISPLLGLDRLPVVEHSSVKPRFSWDAATWKLASIEKFVGGRPWAWVDDSAYSYDNSLFDEDDQDDGLDTEVPHLVIAPWHREGLAREHVDRLIKWAKSLEES